MTAQLYFWLRFKERQKDNLAPTLIKRDLQYDRLNWNLFFAFICGLIYLLLSV